jgi:hypothetical protein
VKKIAIIVLVAVLGVTTATALRAWGFRGHKRISRVAVFTLPRKMAAFYESHIDYLEEHSVDADKRRSNDKQEAPRHYIDIDHYGESPFDSMPKTWDAAVVKYSEDTLKKWGILPWTIETVMNDLTQAFRNRNEAEILRLSADLCHYIADAHVPLHTTKNHDGQLTNQKGLHAFWESRLPELYGDGYNYAFPKAVYLADPLQESWNIIKASSACLDSVLGQERLLNSTFDPEKKWVTIQRGERSFQGFSDEYSKEYHRLLNGMVERRLNASIAAVGNYWYTAWVNAGKPNLRQINTAKLTKEQKARIAAERNRWKNGEIIVASTK